MFVAKLYAWVFLGVITMLALGYWDAGGTARRTAAHMAQMEDKDEVLAAIRQDYSTRQVVYVSVSGLWVFLGSLLFFPEANALSKKLGSKIQ